MTLSEIYTNIHTQLSKDGNSGLISMDKFNTLLPSIFYELIRDEATKNSVILENGNEELISLRILSNLIVSKIVTGLSSFELTSTRLDYDMLYWGAMRTTNAYNGAIRKIKLITHQEFISRYSNMLLMDIDEKPVAYIKNISGVNYAYIFPNDIPSIDFIFIKKPEDPFLDYYMDANYKTQFMAADSSHALTAGEQYRDGTTTGTKVSQTVELELHEDYHVKFQDMLIARMSLPIDDQYKNQYATVKEQK